MMNGLWSHYQSVMAAAEKNPALTNGNIVSIPLHIVIAMQLGSDSFS